MKQRYKLYLLSLLLLVISTGLLQAGNDQDRQVDADLTVEQLKAQIPGMLSNVNNSGTEFYFSFPPCYEQAGQNNNLKLYISSGVATEVTVAVKRHNYIRTKTTIPNDIIEFNIAPGIGQPFVKPAEVEAPPDAVYPGGGVHVYADAPIIVYGVTRFQYTSDGFLAIPVSALGKEYIVSSYSDMSAMYQQLGIKLPSETTITAAFDDTRVFFTMGGNVISKTASGQKPGETRQFKMDAGDVLSINTRGFESDLSGSYVRATKPVAVVSGNQCANVPTGLRWCDFIIEADLPMHTWGYEYHVTKIIKRMGNSWIKIYAKEPNTTVYRNGQVIGLIQRAGGIEGEGFIHRQIADGPAKSYVISGDKPIYVVQYNPGQEFDNVTADPWQIACTPLEQYQTEVTFNTPGIRGGFGFAENYVNLVYALDENGSVPADLEFAKVNNGEFEWRAVKDIFGAVPGDLFEVEVAEGKEKYAMKTLPLPGDGVYKIRAKKPFAGYAYGQDNYDTYGFPISVALGDLSVDDPDAPVPTFEQECDGSVEGSVMDMPDDDKRRSNLASVRMIKENNLSFNYIFEVDEFEPGAARSTDWNLKVEDPTLPAQATLVFVDRAGNSHEEIIQYTPFTVVADQESIDFGLIKVGNSEDRILRLENMSKTSPMTIEKLELTNNDQGFSIDSPPGLPFTLSANDGLSTDYFVDLVIRFDANAIDNKVGEYEDELRFGGECSDIPVALKAEVGEPIVNVEDWDFGQLNVGGEATKTLRLINSGSAPLVINGVSGPGNAVFTVEYPAGFDPNTNPVVVDADGGEVRFDVTFKPDVDQPFSDQIVFDTDATREDEIAVLNGSAVTGNLLAEGYDWERRRINRGPYGGGTITITNGGEADVQLKSVAVVDESPANSQDRFFFAAISKWVADRQPLYVKPDVPVVIPAEFDPQVIGPHKLTVEFTYDAPGEDGLTIQAVLQGIGTQGVLSTEDYDFGQLLINNPTPNTRTVAFENVAGPYNDPVEITGFDVDMTIGSGSVAGEFSDPNDASVVSLPVTLQPGERLEFAVDYLPQFTGTREELVTTISDADAETSGRWYGTAISDGIDGRQVNFPEICAGQTEVIEVEVDNSAGGTFDVNGFAILNLPDANFNILRIEYDGNTYGPGDSFQMQPNTTALVFIEYAPGDANTHTNVLRVFNTTQNSPEFDIPLSARAFDFVAQSALAADLGGRPHVVPGDPFTVRVGINDRNIESDAGATALNVLLRYDAKIIKADVRSVNVLQGDLNGTPILTIDRGTGLEELTFTIDLTNVNGEVNIGEIANVQFGAMLADYTKEEEQKTLIEADIEVVGSQCARIAPSEGRTALGVVCAIDLRNVTLSRFSYGLQQNSPNPASVNTTIEYSIGIEAHTTLELYNAMGELIETAVDNRLSPGKYDVTLETAELPTGVYFYKITSGPFSETRRMVITR